MPCCTVQGARDQRAGSKIWCHHRAPSSLGIVQHGPFPAVLEQSKTPPLLTAACFSPCLLPAPQEPLTSWGNAGCQFSKHGSENSLPH